MIKNSKQRAYLKGLAMNMTPIIQIGKSSVTPELTQAVEEALEARELIKISVLQNCLDDPRQMGGTFDPVHMVHLTLAENAYHSFGLDEVLMLPNGDPPHKTDKIITPAVHRLAMLQLAVEGIPYFRISDMEIRRKGYSYSSVTLEELKKAHPDTDYYFIMGADSLFQIETWHEPAVIMADCVILAAMRNHTPDDVFKKQMEYSGSCTVIQRN